MKQINVGPFYFEWEHYQKVEAEYFGGTGYQNGLLYRNSVMTLHCVQKQDAINKVLQGLGVVKAEGQDEFDTVGLGKYRSNEGWIHGQ